MQQLQKHTLNFDFKDVLFEDNLQQPYKTIAHQKNGQSIQKDLKDDKNRNQQTMVRPQSSKGLKYDQNQRDQIQQLKGMSSKQNTKQQKFQQPVSAKKVKFDQNYAFQTNPNIQANCYFPQQLINSNSQTQNSQQQKYQIIKNNNNKQQQQQNLKQNQTQENTKNLDIFQWDDDDSDNNYYIKDSPQQKIPVKKYETIEKQNLEQFLQKIQKTDVIETSIKQNQELLKQQQREIKQKLDNIEQLRMNEIIQNKLVISQVHCLEDEGYDQDFEEDAQIQQKPIKEIQKDMNYDEVYEEENFEIDEENKVQEEQMQSVKVQNNQQEKDESKNSQLKPDKQQNKKQEINHQKVKSNESLIKTQTKKNVVYKAKNAKERKQELINMRSDLEKHLLQNNPKISKMFQELQETQEKERIMIEVNTKRQEELSQAKLTLKQLQDKFARQQQIIDELDKKEHYANQIIQKLTENKKNYNTQWENQMEKYMACKVIARFLKGRRDRKLFKEFRRQSFINRLKQ